MDEKMKHRVIGMIVIVSILMILSPIVLKTTEPSWQTLHRRGEFQIPKKPKPLPTVIVKRPVKEWRAPTEFNTKNLDNKEPIKLTLKEVKALPMKSRVESLPKVVSKPAEKNNIASLAPPRQSRVSNKHTSAHSVRAYHIQVATFSLEKNALKLKYQLEKLNKPAFVKRYRTHQGKHLYQVHLVGSFDKNEASRVAVELKKRLRVDSLLRRG